MVRGVVIQAYDGNLSSRVRIIVVSDGDTADVFSLWRSDLNGEVFGMAYW